MLSLRDRGRYNNSLCSQMLTFWCATFAKEATLVYPEELCDALRQFRHMGGRIELPGWPEDDKLVTVVADSLNGYVEVSIIWKCFRYNMCDRRIRWSLLNQYKSVVHTSLY